LNARPVSEAHTISWTWSGAASFIQQAAIAETEGKRSEVSKVGLCYLKAWRALLDINQ